MAPPEVCIVCGEIGDRGRLGVWLVEGNRAVIHADCWIAEYKAGNLHMQRARKSA
jgi:hypothetical protein